MLGNFIEQSINLDMFKAPVKINLPGKRNAKTGEKEYSNKKGSFIGFILTAMCIFLIGIITAFLIQRMYSF